MAESDFSVIKQQFEEAASVLKAFKEHEQQLNNIEYAAQLMAKAFENGNKVISCGNGGSMCDAMHFAEELTGRFRNNRRALPAMAISDGSYLSCAANDFGYDQVFERYIEAFGNAGDILLGISTSGNSPNVIKAMNKSHQHNMKVIGLTGKDGGKVSELCDIEIRAPYSEYADRAQEIHIKVIHSLIAEIEKKLKIC